MQLDTEEIVKESAAIAHEVEGGIKSAWTLTGMVPYLHLGLLIALIVLVIYMTQCGKSKNEKELQNLNNQGVEKTAEVQAAQTKSDQAEANSKQADQRVVEVDRTAKQKVAQANAARTANTKNSSYTDANKQRCLTYPESEECK